ncbi:E3 ubiquitin/ISG15 ligase TRIM25-like isoform X2 [Myxocyprinus asiaticus]|uniref:E3 ubiquitin/ISG15 ligase TRIM25-like isoform X2 n=1 Tax=Myxocyprinus asiaticus TaxID=70543 RepID=UPI002221C30D|nr:E3 ubiquitin/ISG15 ligase TRIM25-like isoform X2 [Myxocyprinus asiaticus]
MAESKQRVTSEKSLEIPQIITSSSGPLTEELQCSICLDVFIDPVTIPCGHSFCKTCLKECWDNSKGCCCPYCKETFSKRPDLKVNTALRQVVQHFKEKSGLRKFCEVLCDICDERKLKAVKSCLVCQSSYCDTHLEPHHRVQRLKKHKLIDAVVNLEDYICQEHEKPLELFCRDDQMCVCLFCAATDHKTHNTVPIVEESGEKKNKLVKTQADVQQMIQDRIKKIQDIKNSAELRKKNTEEQTAASVELFMALMRSIERCQAELLEVMEEKQKAAEKQDEELIKELEKEITELKRKDAELEQLSHTEDHLYLLQIHPSLCSPPQTQSWTDVSTDTHLGVYMLRKFLNPLQMTLEEKLSETVSTELKMIHQHKAGLVHLTPAASKSRVIMSHATQRKRRTASTSCSRRGNSKRNRSQTSHTAMETIDVLESDRTNIVPSRRRQDTESYVLSSDEEEESSLRLSPGLLSTLHESSRARSTPGAVSCPVCMDAYSEITDSGRLMVSTKCGHLFCSQCLRDSLSRAHSCPTCRKKLTHKQYHPIYI